MTEIQSDLPGSRTDQMGSGGGGGGGGERPPYQPNRAHEKGRGDTVRIEIDLDDYLRCKEEKRKERAVKKG